MTRPALEEFKGLVFKKSKADAAAALNLGGVEVAAAGTGADG